MHQAKETLRHFSPEQEWDMRVDINWQALFPQGDCRYISLYVDIVVWSFKVKVVHLLRAVFEVKSTKRTTNHQVEA